MTLDTCNFIAENTPIPINFHKCYMFEYLPAFSSTCPRPFEPDLAMETPHGQAFFSGLKDDSFSKDDHQGLKSTHDCRFDDGNHDDEKACRMKTFFVIETTNLIS